ncbi:MAG: hypothetical protein JWM62_297 [Frankiales bacterium]|nr:hypothetical protein [Frankiales bacterium]
MPDRRHLLVVSALSVVALLALVLAVTVTAWALAALPFCVVGAFGAWIGLDLGRFADAVGFTDDDAGRGVPGMLP